MTRPTPLRDWAVLAVFAASYAAIGVPYLLATSLRPKPCHPKEP